MANVKTGFDKLVESHSGVSVVPVVPSGDGGRRVRDVRDVRGGGVQDEGGPADAGRGSAAPAVQVPPRGRPPKYGKRETVAINFRIDAELKYQLEEIKYRTHRSSVTDILVEAINDVVKKYSV